MNVKIGDVFENSSKEKIRVIGINGETIIFVYINKQAVGKIEKESLLNNYKIVEI